MPRPQAAAVPTVTFLPLENADFQKGADIAGSISS
jgi:hypothetical protein